MSPSAADVNKLKDEFLQAACDLFENILAKPPTHNIVDLWKEHQQIRKTLEEISAKQAQLGDTDRRLLKPRSPEDLACFLKWADSVGIKRYGVTVSECHEVSGLGLLAEENISEKHCCLTVPRHAIISTDLAKKSSLKILFERDSIVRNMANVGLALFICAQRVESDSKWTSYLNVLPNVYTTPLFYTEEELQYLKPSPVFEEALLFYRTVARQFIYYLLLIKRNDFHDRASRSQRARTQPPLLYSTPFTVVNFTFSLYRWSVGTVTTRINLIPSETTRDDGAVEMVPALIPVLDMANHEIVLGTEDLGEAVSFSTENDCAEVLATKDILAGEWVSMFYGRRSCAEHLLHNGFVPSDNNPFDSYKLKISLGRSDKMFKEKQKLFVEMGFSESSNVYMHDVTLGPHPFHPSMEHFARVYVADNPEAASDPATLRKAVNFLRDRFAILERAYGTMAEEGKEEVKTWNEINMDRLKRAELAILRNARLYCEEWEKRLPVSESNIQT
ncbi:hypothetical protein KIN20_032336 [Parelaphostrongylus tenuis]|uniref:protein-histidine N-methyltransferase n=1 Tax=Parelaphostrongylus tenuis TaxID=148309 RepID=A0AAD5WHY8_PARTN|nr:hypothetical protein KIN20_032336 [Parelaphostrongylus tenuis]